jgi:2-keto-4-pentenoate hydratase/2-oxohepta-3-ene-1,7-dioic acid hydratase in catechol pathway
VKIGLARQGEGLRLYRVVDDRAYAIPEAMGGAIDLASFLAGGFLRNMAENKGSEGQGVAVSDLQWASPIQRGQKVLAAAVNYRTHGQEAGVAPPSRPFLFVKLASSFVGPHDPIYKPAFSQKMDYEVELGVMIGRTGANIPVAEAWHYVAGYLVVNDVSFRDWQIDASNPDGLRSFGQDWLHGKGMDRSSPSGPFLVTREEGKDGPFVLSCRVNGQEVQRARTDEMIFDIPHLIEAASRGVTLYAGDVISTGTPAGVALGGTHPYLQVGDEVVTEIEGIGRLRNRVVGDESERS